MFSRLLLSVALGLSLAGCGGGEATVTDPSQLPPLTEEQQKAVRAADDAIAAEENANPTQPRRPGAK